MAPYDDRNYTWECSVCGSDARGMVCETCGHGFNVNLDTQFDEDDDLSELDDYGYSGFDEDYESSGPWYPEDFEDYNEFADPGGRSSLRAAFPSNPRIYPCPTCKRPNMLTRKDVQLHYQCDRCADIAEGRIGGDY